MPIALLINTCNAPLPLMRRARDVGTAVGTYLRTLESRVLVIGSGGLSHSPETLTREIAKLNESQRSYRAHGYIESAGRKINSAWDNAFLDALTAGDWPALEHLSVAEIESAGVGANEVRTWLAASAQCSRRP